ncbi:MAG TPA: glycosyltransferase [Candidatus Omnitrophota bacterium]|nr:glycosyltransferase [Candidatus Omnitrophota bacterium]
MNEPKVSVVIPCYNAKRTIGLTLQALIQQTYPGPIEILSLMTVQVIRPLSSFDRFPT